MYPASRNSACPCGSGNRLKHCCGAASRGGNFGPGLGDIMASALARQKAMDLAGAEALYRQALSIRPDEPDCLHMLGVICLQTGRNDEAFEVVYRALSLTEWRIDAMRHNMGFILARFLAAADADATRHLQKQYLEYCRQRDASRVDCDPLVSIVIPSYNHARWIQKALESVYSQTYRRLEVIVIDDGSTDNSVELIRHSLATCPFPNRFIARENRGAPVTINEGVALATGEYINILNSDDWFPDDRIATMVEGVARRDEEWGFGGVSFVNATDKTISPAENRRVLEFSMRMEQRSKREEPLGVSLMNFNFMISTGNLFVRKSFLDALGGFRDYRYNHDWDFCLRATLESEPVFVHRNVYVYRLHESNTIGESAAGQGSSIEFGRIFSDYFVVATKDQAPRNKFAPTAQVWGTRFFEWVMRDGKAELAPPRVLQQMADIVLNGAQWNSSAAILDHQGEETENLIEAEKSELPDGFDSDIYLKLNPDVAAAGVDPTTHYLEHGRDEGRRYGFAAIDLCGGEGFKSGLETILVVSHEASRTGAPILSLNLVQALVERYNVVALLLGGGPLSDAFRQVGAAVMASPGLRGSPIQASLAVDKLCERFNFKFALVNSIESRVILPALSGHFVPTVSLIHEFAAYTRPRNAFIEAILWSGRIVFSTRVTMENARSEYPYLGDWSADILPQGRCLVPLEEFSEQQIQAERARIRRLIRPKDIAGDSVVVLGAGFVQLRKGVDLFIECAALVRKAAESGACRFVWVGKGYDPENDIGYSVYLEDQIRRAGLQDHVFFMDETAAIEVAYEEADLLLLSSRLDPLPNVAIDAMAHGVPVLCFDKTTGIADFLTDSGFRNDCVAGYLDSADMAKKILTLAGSAVLREQVGERCREAATAYFSMKDYIARLEVLARSVSDSTQQEKADVQVILDSGLFRPDFSCPPTYARGRTAEGEIRAYVRAWASGVSRRKPFPGFHPGIYLERHGVAVQGADPLADYLRAGRPDGPWNYPVIIAGEAGKESLPDSRRVALHIHAYYPELLPEIFFRLSRNRARPDLFISISDKDARALVAGELENYQGRVVDIQLVPNRGRDIGPFLTAFGQRIMADYDFIGHIHTKKSADVRDAAMGSSWYRFLLENLLGGEAGSMADRILSKMEADASIGMVFPDDPYVVGWSGNQVFAESLAARMTLDNLPKYFNFPVGTMFWARTLALAPLMNCNLGWDDYPEEPLPYDGTLLHALERLFSFVGSANDLRCAVTNVKGITR
jgi:glycosyltransferase involved in cell wall biosynthesis